VRWSTPLVDVAQAVAVTGSGEVVVGGFVSATSLEGSGESAGKIWRLTASGEALGTITVDRGGIDGVEALSALEDGRVLFAGRAERDEAGAGAGLTDALVGVIQGGEIVHQVRVGDERPQRPRSVVLRADRSAILVGGQDDIFVPTNHVEDWQNPGAFELPFHDAGLGPEPSWVWAPRTPVDDRGASAVDGADGASFLVGSRAAGAGRGAFLVKLGGNGQPLWTRQLSSLPFDHAEMILRGTDGTLVIAGATLGTLGGANAGEQDAFVLGVDPGSGDVLWARQFGTPGPDWVTGLVIDPDGTIFVGGETYGSFFEDRPAPEEGADLFLARLTPEQGPVQVWQGGTAGDDLAGRIARDRCGHTYMVGSTAGSLAGGGSYDAFVLQVADEELR
jgi:hypothetical protein